MDTLKLNVLERKESGKSLSKLREDGFIPAVRYGHSKEPMNLSVRYIDFTKLYKAAGESTIVELSFDGKKAVNVLVHDVQIDPLSGRFMHIDFYQVDMNEEIETDIPLEFVGEAPAVKALGGVLIKNLDEVKVKCLPKDLPHSLAVDLARLATFDDQFKVSDIVLPAGVEMLETLETIVALVEAPRTEAEVAALDEKVEMDVTKVEGVVKETPEGAEGEKKEEKK
ncbi:MAG: 50S ribosomal protein L25 [Candidatus Moraniibacteriota bacterium]|nr:MAG: 50S ribosomal protein L25 [Candidatus Moranbacteria bacterium]